MQCARCKSGGVKFYNVPSRKRGEFVEQVCRRCYDVERKEALAEKRKKLKATETARAPRATQLGF